MGTNEGYVRISKIKIRQNVTSSSCYIQKKTILLDRPDNECKKMCFSLSGKSRDGELTWVTVRVTVRKGDTSIIGVRQQGLEKGSRKEGGRSEWSQLEFSGNFLGKIRVERAFSVRLRCEQLNSLHA